MHDALDRASIREGEFQSLQKRMEEREGHTRKFEVLEGEPGSGDLQVKGGG